MVEELHLRRAARGLNPREYGPQEQIKELIRLMHRHGSHATFNWEADFNLLAHLKGATFHLRRLKPKSCLNSMLLELDGNWAWLLQSFEALLSHEAARTILRERLAEAESYGQLQRILHFAFTWSQIRFQEGKTKSKFLLDERDLDWLAAGTSCLWQLMMQHKSWSGQIPLLRIHSGIWILSPEMLYDDLLKKYIALRRSFLLYPYYRGRVAE